MPEKHGTKELDEFLEFLAVSANAGAEAKMNDGKIDLADLPLIAIPAMKAPAAFMGIAKISTEIGDLSPEEAEASRARLVQILKLPVGMEDVEKVTEDGVMNTVNLFKWIKDLQAVIAKYR